MRNVCWTLPKIGRREWEGGWGEVGGQGAKMRPPFRNKRKSMVRKILVKNQGLRGHFQRFLSKIFKKSKNAAPPPGPDFGKISPRLPSSCFSLFRARSGKTRAKKTLKSDGGVLKFRPWWPSPATSTTPAHTTAAHPPHRGASQTGGAGGGGGGGLGGQGAKTRHPFRK